jgi:hypothetical protein
MKGDPMGCNPAHVAVVTFTLIGAIGASPCIAQTRATSLEDLRGALAEGDFITVVPVDGPPVAGRLMRLGTLDLDVRPVTRRAPQAGGPRQVTIPFDTIQSLERPRDSSRNGAVLGAGIGAGFAGAMFVHALVVDRNELNEWAASYVGAAALCTAIGALVGWATDAAKSKPPIRFDAPPRSRTKISVQPLYSPGRGLSLTVSVSR